MILYHGCHLEAGHFWWAPGMARGLGYPFRRHRHNDHWEDNPYRYVPWGYAVDGGLAPRGKLEFTEGAAALSQSVRLINTPEEEWWSAISWWDNSIDKRPASNVTFVVDRRADGPELLAGARAAFPQVFERIKYEIVFPVSP